MRIKDLTYECFYDIIIYKYSRIGTGKSFIGFKHGNLEIQCTYVDESGFPLGMWLWRIRGGKIELRTEGVNGNQLERLRTIGFEFSTEAETPITQKQ